MLKRSRALASINDTVLRWEHRDGLGQHGTNRIGWYMDRDGSLLSVVFGRLKMVPQGRLIIYGHFRLFTKLGVWFGDIAGELIPDQLALIPK